MQIRMSSLSLPSSIYVIMPTKDDTIQQLDDKFALGDWVRLRDGSVGFVCALEAEEMIVIKRRATVDDGMHNFHYCLALN